MNLIKDVADGLNSSALGLRSAGTQFREAAADHHSLLVLNAAIGGLGGLTTMAKGLIKLSARTTTRKTAEMSINIAKWGPWAPVVAAAAAAAGYAFGKFLDSMVSTEHIADYTTPEGRRELSLGGVING